MTLFSAGWTLRTRPFFPFSLPAMTTTVSFIRILVFPLIMSLSSSAGGSQMTSGAREMIFMYPLERSSRATGPKMRVPIGSLWLLISTAAF